LTTINGQGMEYRITITMGELGKPEVAEKNVERIFEAFYRTHPEVEAVVGTNGRAGTIDITFSLVARSLQDAFDRGAPIFADGMEAAEVDLPASTEHDRIEVEAVPAEEPQQEHELQPA
jgi:hypothetical protein